ncbi:MAG: Fumble domain-containing protein [Chloroflexi bacterium]|nr:MAG: Fumble domain-containing protein [Chloroflexota bacterium]
MISVSTQSTQAAIDFGISNTDTVARTKGRWQRWTRAYTHEPDEALVRAILADRDIDLEELPYLAVTGGRHRLLPERIGQCRIIGVDELTAIGRGGQAMAGLAATADEPPVLVVSGGSGTAMVAARGNTYTHATGTAVGGGTMLGLARLLLGTVDPHEIDALAQAGNPNGADLSLADVVTGPIGALPADATAVNFGRLARSAAEVSRPDLAAALVTMVGQVIGLLAIQAARARQIERIIVTGHLTDMPSIRRVLESVGRYYATSMELPTDAGYATALGAMLHAEEMANRMPGTGR